MKNTLMLTSLVLGFAISGAPAMAAGPDLGTAVEQVITEASRVSTEAQEIRQLLRSGRPDVELVRQRVAALETHAASLKEAIATADAAGTTLTPVQAEALARARRASDTLRVLLANKASMLQDGESVRKNRGLLRAKAEGIARRADIVRQQMGQVRS